MLVLPQNCSLPSYFVFTKILREPIYLLEEAFRDSAVETIGTVIINTLRSNRGSHSPLRASLQ